VADNEEEDNKQAPSAEEGPKSLKDELNVEDLSCCIFFKDQKLFAAAGPELPLLQMNTDGTFVSLPPDAPYRKEIDEVLIVTADKHGRLFDALGEIRRLVGMKYKGQTLYFMDERHPENGQNLAAWFDDDMKPHYLHLGDTILSAIMVLRIRDRMIDGELSAFPEITSD
jgi:hypothetical protein